MSAWAWALVVPAVVFGVGFAIFAFLEARSIARMRATLRDLDRVDAKHSLRPTKRPPGPPSSWRGPR